MSECDHKWVTLSPGTDYGVAQECSICHRSRFVYTVDFCDCNWCQPYYPYLSDWSGMKCRNCDGLIRGTGDDR